MRCYNCSIELSDEATVCLKCGKPIQQEYECVCGEFLDADEEICPSCGIERNRNK